MTFPTLSRRHVATPIPRCKRKSHRKNQNPTCNSNTEKVSSPLKCARSESLRSTWMTNGSDSAEDDQELQDDSRDLQVFVQLQRPLSDWVYWQRDAVALPDCWTRVFAVFCGNILWLYRYEDASAKSLLVRMRVTALDVGEVHQLQFRDAATASRVQLYMPDAPAFFRWHSHVSSTVAKFPPVEEERAGQNIIVSAVASAMQKKNFWKALAKAVTTGAKSSRHYQVARAEENAMVVYDRQSRKSLGQRWKNVTTTVKGALKLSRQHPQLQL